MVKKEKPRVIPEQDGRIIGTICMCQLTMVLSGVALVYLSVAVYAPSHRAFHSGIDPVPVMCETINTASVSNSTWESCGEWCLSKSSGASIQIKTMVRRNGSLLELQGCKSIRYTNCTFGATLGDMLQSRVFLPKSYQKDNLTRLNCNKDGSCRKMSGIWNCTLGQCSNFSQVWQCQAKPSGHYINVERDSSKLTGLFECHSINKKSKCIEIPAKKNLECERVCPDIKTAAATVFIQEGEGVYSADCNSASAFDPSAPGPASAPLWIPSDGNLLASCYTFEYDKTAQSIRATDCINGTIVPPSFIPRPWMNFSQLRYLWETAMKEKDFERIRSNGVIRGGALLPSEQMLYIFNTSSNLQINLKGCVNTLRGECMEFLENYGFDGRNFSARSRYPCFYNRKNSSTVLARFDLNETWRELLIASLIPAILFVISLTTLCIITRSVKVGDDAKLRCLLCCSNTSRQPIDGHATPTPT